MTEKFSAYLQWRIIGHNLKIGSVSPLIGIGRKAIYGHMTGQYPRVADLKKYATYFKMKDEHELDGVWRKWEQPKDFKLKFAIETVQKNAPGRPSKVSENRLRIENPLSALDAILNALKFDNIDKDTIRRMKMCLPRAIEELTELRKLASTVTTGRMVVVGGRQDSTKETAEAEHQSTPTRLPEPSRIVEENPESELVRAREQRVSRLRKRSK